MTTTFKTSSLTDPAFLRSHVFPRLLPKRRKSELEELGIAFFEIWDLLLVAAVEIFNDAWTMLPAEPLRRAGLSLTNIFHQAVHNAEKNVQIDALSDVMNGLGVATAGELLPIYVVQVNNCPFGAGALLSEDVRFKLHDIIGPEYYVLPSSVHEILAIPASDDASSLLEMVRTINASDVISDDDFLSDSVYYCHHHGLVDVIE